MRAVSSFNLTNLHLMSTMYITVLPITGHAVLDGNYMYINEFMYGHHGTSVPNRK